MAVAENPGDSLAAVGHAEPVHLVQVSTDDDHRLDALAGLLDAVRRHDDPDAFPVSAAELAREVRYGYDLHPPVLYALEADATAAPVGVLSVEAPVRDNRHLLYGEITVHPQHRRRGYGSRLLDRLLDLAAELGRHTLWVPTPTDDRSGNDFLRHRGFDCATVDARRHQVLGEVDRAQVERLRAEAARHGGDYRLERVRPPYGDDLLSSLIEVTAAINDAPMGSLDFEDEVFDLDRLRDAQTARARRGESVYRGLARHRGTGEVGGHTCVVLHPDQPTLGHQGDTAVARAHRGHRLGLALKIEMLDWLAEAEPQLQSVDTWNNADNRFMIDVNEALGYRLSRSFATYQRRLTSPP